MAYDVRDLAGRKAAETQQDEMEWLRVLETARQSLRFVEIDYQSLENIALASGTPAKFTTVVRLIYQYGKSHPTSESISGLILQYANDSQFSLSDWIDAIHFFHDWLRHKNRRVDLLAIIQYLQCCAVSPDAKEGGQSFCDLVKDMFDVHGYDGYDGP